jgi:hypothetical protein
MKTTQHIRFAAFAECKVQKPPHVYGWSNAKVIDGTQDVAAPHSHMIPPHLEKQHGTRMFNNTKYIDKWLIFILSDQKCYL